MIKAIKLIFAPMKEWEKTATANPSVLWVLLTFVIPVFLLSGLVEGYGLIRLGERRGEFGQMALLPQDMIIRYEAVSLGLLLAIVFIGASLLVIVTQSFQVPVQFRQCFSAVGYSMAPLALVKILDAHPMMNTWMCWGIGVVMVASMLYHGVAQCLKPEQTKAFGIYVFSVVFIGGLSGLAHFISVLVLHGKLLKPAGIS
jgi:hypothetical protein